MSIEKFMLGKVLGEIYELRNEIAIIKKEKPLYKKSTIQLLKNGFEHAINLEFNIGAECALSEDKYNEIFNLLAKFEEKSENVNNLAGYWSLPGNIINKYSENVLLSAFQEFKAEGDFLQIIEKIEKGHSPSAFSNLDIDK